MLILLLEDHKAIRDMLRIVLTRDSHDVIEAGDVAQAKMLALEESPELIIVDWMLPDISGVDFIRWLRRREALSTTPVLMLTAKDQETDTVNALDAGADDYMTKPVAIQELLARVRALGRRPRQFDADVHLLQAGPVKIDTVRYEVSINDQPADIRQSEYKLLKFFVAHPERVWSRSQILDRVWGRSVYVDERTVDVHILRLRKRLKPFGADHLLKTVRGVGYQLVAS